MVSVISPPHLGRATVTFLNAWGSLGTGDGQFDEPFRVAVAPDGRVYVADRSNDRVQRFSEDGTFELKWGSEGTGDGQFLDPLGLSIAPTGSVYVADGINDRIQRFSTDGVFEIGWGSTGGGNGEFRVPIGISVAPTGTVYVSDFFNDRIQRFSKDGAFELTWGSPGAGNGQFDVPFDVAVAPTGQVYVADIGNDRIQRFADDGLFELTWGSSGSGDGQFSLPAGVSVAQTGQVYVADNFADRIQRFSADGTFELMWGSSGNAPGQFSGPTGIAVAATGQLYVADDANNRIQRFFDSDVWVSGTNTFADASVGADKLLGVSQTLAPLKTLIVTGATSVKAGGTLTLAGGSLVATVLNVDGGSLILDGGTLTSQQLNVQAGGTLISNSPSTVTTGPVTAHGGSTIDATSANLTLGDANTPSGFVSEGTLLIGSQTVTLLDADRALLGSSTTLAGGTIVATHGVSVGAGEQLTGSGTIAGSLFLGDGGTVSMSGAINGAVKVLTGGTITASGDLTMGDASTNLGFQGDGTLNVGPHTVTLVDQTVATVGQATIDGGTLNVPTGLLLEPGDTLSGTGLVQGHVDSQAGSTITATGPLTMGDASSTSGFVSEGTLAVGSQTVTLRDADGARLGSSTTLAGGTIVAANGVSVGLGEQLTGSGTIAGSLFLGNGGTVSMSGAINGAVKVLTGGTITASGDLTMGDASTNLGFQGDGTLNVGPHTVTLVDQTVATVGQATIDGGTLNVPTGLLLEPGDTLSGTGLVQGHVDSQAGSTITATGPLTLGDATMAIGFVMAGNLDIGSNSVTLLDSTIAALGANTTLAGGTLTAANGVRVEAGEVIRGFGTLDGPVENQGGDLSPGSELGSLAIVGDYSQDAGSVTIEVGGLNRGTEYDFLDVQGAIALSGGALEVLLADAFAPSAGDSFDVLDFNSISGAFGSIVLAPLGDSLFWDTSRLLVDGTLSVHQGALTGDMDGDGDVDFDDIGAFVLALNDPAAYEAMFGVPPAVRGDTDGDGDHDFDDIDGFVSILTSPTGDVQSVVPEPSSAMLVVIAFATMVGFLGVRGRETGPRKKTRQVPMALSSCGVM